MTIASQLNQGGHAETALNIPIDQIPALHPAQSPPGPTEPGLPSVPTQPRRWTAAVVVVVVVLASTARAHLPFQNGSHLPPKPTRAAAQVWSYCGRVRPAHVPSPEPPTCSSSCWHFRQINTSWTTAVEREESSGYRRPPGNTARQGRAVTVRAPQRFARPWLTLCQRPWERVGHVPMDRREAYSFL